MPRSFSRFSLHSVIILLVRFAVAAPLRSVVRSSSHTERRSLSGGSYAGVAVGVVSMFSIAALLVWLWHTRRKRVRRVKAGTPIDLVSESKAIPAVDESRKRKKSQPDIPNPSNITPYIIPPPPPATSAPQAAVTSSVPALLRNGLRRNKDSSSGSGSIDSRPRGHRAPYMHPISRELRDSLHTFSTQSNTHSHSSQTITSASSHRDASGMPPASSDPSRPSQRWTTTAFTGTISAGGLPPIAVPPPASRSGKRIRLPPVDSSPPTEPVTSNGGTRRALPAAVVRSKTQTSASLPQLPRAKGVDTATYPRLSDFTQEKRALDGGISILQTPPAGWKGIVDQHKVG